MRWIQKSFLAFLLASVINLASSSGLAQECQYRYNEGTGQPIPDLIFINDVEHRVFTIEESRDIAKKLVRLTLLEEKYSSLEVDYNLLIASREYDKRYISFLEGEVERTESFVNDLVLQYPPKGVNLRFIERPMVNFTIGFGLASAAYFFWDYARDN